MTCQSKEEFFLDNFKDNLVPDDFPEAVQMGMNAFGVGLGAHLATKGVAGARFAMYNDVKLSIISGGVGAGEGIAASYVGAAAALASSIALGAIAGTAAAGLAPMAAIALGAHVIGAAAQALYQTENQEDQPNSGGCPFPDDAPPPDDPHGNPTGNSGSRGGPAFVPPNGPLNPRWDPLVIDLLGDGLDFISVDASTVQFDLNSDGFRETAGWIGLGTGLVIRDANGNGAVDDASELIGNAEETAYEVLATFDDNQDGYVDASDAAFSELRIWQDLDQDGQTDAGELSTLAALGVERFQVAGVAAGLDVEGNLLAFTGSAVGTGSTTFQTGAVYFTTNMIVSEWQPPTGFNLDPETYGLPNLAGYGLVKDLNAAMTLDVDLKEMVETLVLSSNAASPNALREAFEAIILRWAGAEDVDPDSRGDWVDAKRLAVVEAFYGQGFFTTNGEESSTNPMVDQVDPINMAYDNIIEVMLTRFTSQVALSRFGLTGDEASLVASPFLALAGLAYSADSDMLEGNLTPTLMLLKAFAPAEGAARLDYLGTALSTFRGAEGEYFGYLPGFNDVLFDCFDGASSSFLYEFTLAVHEADGVMGRSAGAGRDVLWAHEDGDLLDGGAGADTYAYTGGDVLIRDGETYGVAADRLLLDNAYSLAVVRVAKSGDDLVLTFDGVPGSIRLIDQDSVFDAGIEQVVFAGGETWTRADLKAAVLAGAGTSGADVIDGFYMTDDVLDGGAGDDILSGRSGSDTFVFGRGYGSDLIAEVHQTYHNPLNIEPGDDVVAFNADTSLADLTVHKVGEDLVISIAGTSDHLTIWRGASNYDWYQVEGFSFASEGFVSLAAMRALAQPVTSRTVASGAASTVELQAGDERLVGRWDVTEVYEYARADGYDVLSSDGFGGGSGGRDSVKFVDVASTEVRFLRSGDNLQDLVIEVGGVDGGRLVIEDQFVLGPFGDINAVDRVTFADDVSFTVQQIVDRMLEDAASAGGDRLWGGTGDDVLEGGGGDDVLQGGRGSDAFVWASGDGHDRVIDSSPRSELGEDALVLHGVDPSDVVVAWGEAYGGEPGSLRISFVGQAGSILIDGQADSAIERVVFDSGATWDSAELSLRASGGFGAAPTHVGTAGVETLTGGAGNDVFDGGAGADILRGGDGNDLYRFGAGSGNDRVEDAGGHPSASADGVQLVGLNPEDVVLGRDADNLHIRILSTGETLTIAGHYSVWNAATATTGIERLIFASGETWDLDRINHEGDIYRGTDAAEEIVAYGGGDNVFIGHGGDDTLRDWYGGDDTYIWSAGDGNDQIREDQGFDSVRLQGVDSTQVALTRTPDNHLAIRFVASGEVVTVYRHFSTQSKWAIEQIVFDDGTWDAAAIAANAPLTGTTGDDWLSGGQGSDVIVGAEGADTLMGGGGSDAYLWAIGDGDDVVRDDGDIGDADEIRFTDVADAGVELTRNGDDLLIRVLATDELITVSNQFWVYDPNEEGNPDLDRGVERLVFANAVQLDRAAILALLPDPEEPGGYDGTAEDDYISAGEEDDVLRGFAGYDVLEGYGGDDRLEGGEDNDELYGGDGADTYVYRDGDGNDLIYDGGEDADVDTLVFEDLDRADVTVEFDRDGLTFRTATGSVELGDQFTYELGYSMWEPSGGGVELVSFADQADVAVSDLLTQALSAGGATVTYGSSGGDTLTGSSGADALVGRGGDDALVGAAGDDRLFAGDGADVLNGGLGSDELVGGAGDDLYLYALGDGDDLLIDADEDGQNDTLQLGAGIAQGDVVVTRVDGDAILTFSGGGGLTLRDQFYGSGVELIDFASGPDWTLSELYERYLETAGTNGSDNIYGSSGDDMMVGLGGDDYLDGDAGADTYLISAGDGQDYVSDSDSSDVDVDRVVFTDLASTSVAVLRVEDRPGDVILAFAGGQQIWLSNTMIGDPLAPIGSGIDEIVFSDTITWDRQDIADAYFAASVTSGADRIQGFGWNDQLTGGAGADTFVFSYEFGHDRIEDFSLAEDVVEVWGAADFEQLMYSAVQAGNDVTIDLGWEGSITLANLDIEDLTAAHFTFGQPQTFAALGSGPGAGGDALFGMMFGEAAVMPEIDGLPALTGAGRPGPDRGLATDCAGGMDIAGLMDELRDRSSTVPHQQDYCFA